MKETRDTSQQVEHKKDTTKSLLNSVRSHNQYITMETRIPYLKTVHMYKYKPITLTISISTNKLVNSPNLQCLRIASKVERRFSEDVKLIKLYVFHQSVGSVTPTLQLTAVTHGLFTVLPFSLLSLFYTNLFQSHLFTPHKDKLSFSAVWVACDRVCVCV